MQQTEQEQEQEQVNEPQLPPAFVPTYWAGLDSWGRDLSIYLSGLATEEKEKLSFQSKKR